MIFSTTRRSEETDRLFLAAIASGMPIGRACKLTGYSRAAVYRYRAEDVVFRAAWADAAETAIELLEEEADRRGRVGVETPVYYKGEIVGETTKYSDTLLLARLKALAPSRYARHAPVHKVEAERYFDFAHVVNPPLPAPQHRMIAAPTREEENEARARYLGRAPDPDTVADLEDEARLLDAMDSFGQRADRASLAGVATRAAIADAALQHPARSSEGDDIERAAQRPAMTLAELAAADAMVEKTGA